MLYKSTRDVSLRFSFRDAVLEGVPKDGGLFLPATLPQFGAVTGSLEAVAYTLAQPFVSPEIENASLKTLIEDAFSFPLPIVELNDRVRVCELFHGPTLAFKDFGARFLARVLSRFAVDINREITVIVATSGDTGGAVAHGFLGVTGVRVVILYPGGRISPIQRAQITTLGHNIFPFEIAGSFDDCQQLVKRALSDPLLREETLLTSANSINIARLLPQIFYYSYMSTLYPGMTISVPSGNLGNLTGGVLAKMLGAPIHALIAAANENNTFPVFLDTGKYSPKRSRKTLSSAMDVGTPNNFERIFSLYDGSTARMRTDVRSHSFSDEQTLAAMGAVFQEHRYLMDPHTAVGYLGLSSNPGIVLATAHPAKFPDIVQQATGSLPAVPAQLEEVLNRKEEPPPVLEPHYELIRDRIMRL